MQVRQRVQVRAVLHDALAQQAVDDARIGLERRTARVEIGVGNPRRAGQRQRRSHGQEDPSHGRQY
jgi:hypothetical protein